MTPRLFEVFRRIAVRVAACALVAVICLDAAGAAPLDPAQGTISLWAQPDRDVRTFDLKQRNLLQEAGIRIYLGGSGAFRADMGDQPLLRFEAMGQPNRTFIPERVDDWRAGEWKHIVVIWDAATGELSAVVNGRAMPMIDEWNGAKVFANRPWTPPAEPPSHAAGEPWPGKVEEVRISGQPWSLAEARAEFLKRGEPSIKVRTLDAFLFAGRQERFRIVFENPLSKQVVIAPEIAGGAKLDKVAIPAGQCVVVAAQLQLPTPGAHTVAVRLGDDIHRIDLWAVDPRVPEVPAKEKLRLVTEVDVVAGQPLTESAPSQVVESTLGQYREAGAQRHDRFAMAFAVKDLMRPHVAVIEYPDDKPRAIEVVLQRLTPPGDPGDYQAQTGVFCGGEYPISNAIHEHRIVFWPTTEKLSFIFMTGEAGRPAAVQRMRIYKLDGGFARAAAAAASGGVPHRRIGIYYEDPVLHKSFSSEPLMPGFSEAVDKLLDYMQGFGQNTLDYPLVWYRGPLYGSEVEPFQGDVATRPHPHDFPRYLMKRLEARGMTFEGGLHIHELVSLAPHIITDQGRVLAGEETVINVQADNTLKLTGFHGNDPSFNPLDPRVQAAVKAIVAEIAERYGDEPAFTGLLLNTPRVKLFTFGSLEGGYNDSNLRRFQEETGIHIPVPAGDRERFSKAHAWLMANARMEWIEWRCRKIHAWYKELAAVLAAKRADLKLTVSLFPHFGLDGRNMADYLASPDSLREALMRQGLDPDLFAGEKNIVLSHTLIPADSRWLRNKPYKITNPSAADARACATAPECMKPLRRQPQGAAVKLHDRYFEDAVGRKSPMSGLGAGVAEQGWRVSTFNPAHVHSLEQYVLPLAHFDALEIIRGGFVVGTLGMEERLREFAAEYAKLPAVPFDDVPGLEDPVRVRQKVVGSVAYCYALNTLPVPVNVTLDLVTGEPLRLHMQPYDLRTFQRDSTVPPVRGGRAATEPAFIQELERQLAGARRAAAPQAYLDLASECWQQGRYARLFRLLQEPWNVNR